MKIVSACVVRARPIMANGGKRVAVTATPGRELLRSFLAQVKLAAIPAAIGIRITAASKEWMMLSISKLFISNLTTVPISIAVTSEVSAEIRKTSIDRDKARKLAIPRESEIARIGDSRGATSMPPISSIRLPLIRPAETMKVDRTRSI